ncbi:unnamed protein product [Peniophora sp. CBMAI 1063]|nr:unnamed protein product [Peniophora sp. CBMAI 1063]
MVTITKPVQNPPFSLSKEPVCDKAPFRPVSIDGSFLMNDDPDVRARSAYEVDPGRCNCGDAAGAAGAALVGGVAGAAIAPPAAVGILGGLGFGGGGVVAGSWAAAIQSGIGSVAAGSPFAVAQSVGAGAALPFIGFAGAAVIGAAAVGGGYVALKKLAGGKKEEKKLGRLQLDYLSGWFNRHADNPIPTDREMIELICETGLSEEDILDWLIQAHRRRIAMRDGTICDKCGGIKDRVEM